MEPQEFLREWAYHYAQHLAVFHASGEKVEKEDRQITVKNSKTAVTYVPAADLDKYSHRAPSANETIQVITFNTDHNLDALIKGWKAFCEHKNVLVIFLNPKSKLDTKWSIHPFVHNKICDEKALKVGLKSIFSNVDKLKKEDIEKLKL